MVPHLGRLARLVDLGYILVDFSLGIHRVPERLAVSWIIAAAEALLVSIVKERNASRGHCKGNSRLEGCPVT